MFSNLNVGFIGSGNMSSALASGILQTKILAAKNLFMVDKNLDKLAKWQQQGANTFQDAADIFPLCDFIFLGIKPQSLPEFFAQTSMALSKTFLQESPNSNNKKPVIISILAGTNLKTLADFFVDFPLVRVMPNLPATIGFATSAACGNSKLDAKSKNLVEKMLQASGTCLWVAETKLDAVTAISGSGPAYFFYIFEIMQEFAQEAGFTKQEARELVLQTALGAANMAQKSDLSSQELKDMVTSKGGTTFAALESFKKDDLKNILFQAMQAAKNRSEELSKL